MTLDFGNGLIFNHEEDISLERNALVKFRKKVIDVLIISSGGDVLTIEDNYIFSTFDQPSPSIEVTLSGSVDLIEYNKAKAAYVSESTRYRALENYFREKINRGYSLGKIFIKHNKIDKPFVIEFDLIDLETVLLMIKKSYTKNLYDVNQKEDVRIIKIV